MRFLGSRRESLFSNTLLALAGHGARVPSPGHPKPGMMTPLVRLGSGGTVTWLPSTPMRKLVEGSPPPPQAPEATPGVAVPPAAGALHTERSPKPMPSAGVRTMPTPLMRSNARDQPARITVFLLPNVFPSRPSPKDGFQATAKRGPKF